MLGGVSIYIYIYRCSEDFMYFSFPYLLVTLSSCTPVLYLEEKFNIFKILETVYLEEKSDYPEKK